MDLEGAEKMVDDLTNDDDLMNDDRTKQIDRIVEGYLSDNEELAAVQRLLESDRADVS